VSDDDLLRLRPEGVEWREIDGEVVALETGRSIYLAANPAGALLWARLAEGATRDDLIAALRAQWPLEPDRAAADVDAFVDQVRAHGLLA
jgi:Coenzyme PQQ synthesis protein D (PqqD)